MHGSDALNVFLNCEIHGFRLWGGGTPYMGYDTWVTVKACGPLILSFGPYFKNAVVDFFKLAAGHLLTRGYQIGQFHRGIAKQGEIIS